MTAPAPERPHPAPDVAALRLALARAPHDLLALRRLAHALAAAGELGEAAELLERVARAAPRDGAARFEQAVVLHRLGRLEAAYAAYRAAADALPAAAEVLQGLGGVLVQLYRSPEAEPVLRRALALARPEQRGPIEENLIAALLGQRKPREALAVQDGSASRGAAAEGRRGGLLQLAGDPAGAAAAYRRALALDPLALPLHAELNDLLYRMGDDAGFLCSYDEAAYRVREPAPLMHAKAQALLTAERPAAAQAAFEAALRASPGEPGALIGLARALAAQGAMDAALDLALRGVRALPSEADPHTALAALLLRAGDAEAALIAARHAVACAPTDQAALAALGTAMRASGDGEEFSLYGYQALVAEIDLEPPAGWSDMAAFNRALEQELAAVHADRREHFDQSLRQGTRSFGLLFGSGLPLVERLRMRIAEAVARYVAALPEIDGHPFTRRRAGRSGFLGSWSSRVGEGGRHVDHIHPGRRAWISSCYYVSCPPAVEDAQARQGWLKLGEPSPQFGLAGPRREVRPRPGLLVLFPSYLWHGTRPFSGDGQRTTIAFDVEPLAA